MIDKQPGMHGNSSEPVDRTIQGLRALQSKIAGESLPSVARLFDCLDPTLRLLRHYPSGGYLTLCLVLSRIKCCSEGQGIRVWL